MADKRMIAKTIIDSDQFLSMPLTAQALYMHLVIGADDDGFINNGKIIQRMVGASDKDFSLLIEKRFLLAFDNGVVVIKHWLMQNTLRKDRYKPTNYQEEKALLDVKSNNAYTYKKDANGNPLYKTWQPNGNQMATQVRQPSGNPISIDKVSIGKVSKDKTANESLLDVLKTYTENDTLKQSIHDFIEMRKKVKKPLTVRALQLNLGKLDKLAANDADKIAIINQSIETGWQSFYELKDKPKTIADPFDSLRAKLGGQL